MVGARTLVLIGLCCLGLAGAGLIAIDRQPRAEPIPAERSVLELSWADLLPEGEAERIAYVFNMQMAPGAISHEGDLRAAQFQTFNVIEALDGQSVRIGGFVLPFDYSDTGEVYRFLLVPYVGACIHMPPPPPNQLVFVRAQTPIRIQRLWEPVFVEGVLRTERFDNALGDTAYTLELETVDRVEFGAG